MVAPAGQRGAPWSATFQESDPQPRLPNSRPPPAYGQIDQT